MVSAQKLLQQLMDSLSARQKEVLTGRFGLSGKEPETLAALGDRYGVTRERIRQIEANALEIVARRIGTNPSLVNLLEKSQRFLRGVGGVTKQDEVIANGATLVDGLDQNQMKLFLEASSAFLEYPEDQDFWPLYYLDKASFKKASDFIAQFVKFLRGRKAEILKEGYGAHVSRFIKRERVHVNLAKSYLGITKKIHANPFGDTGLAEWPEIKPRTIRDRIYLVLAKHGKPVHFTAIAELINQTKFGGRKALAPTVHNELIKDSRFVLVGRGVYGLAEHGYETGTAKEVIHKTLRENGPLNLNQVVMAVQKSRIFKPNTILANLQRKDLFERLKNGTYRVRES